MTKMVRDKSVIPANQTLMQATQENLVIMQASSQLAVTRITEIERTILA